MKDHNFWQRVENFVLGKGFYIALALCVAAIGVSGYLLYDAAQGPETPSKPVEGKALVELPDQPPAPSLPKQPSKPAEQKKPDKPVEKKQDKPAEPEQKPEQTPEPKKEEPVVYTWPVNGAVLREFSVETLMQDPTMGDWRTHRGVDIAADAGANVLAIGRGRVSEVYDDGLMGTTVVMKHPDGVTSVCSGLAADVPVAVGDELNTGDVIGTVGNTAIAESGMESHIHLETWRADEPTDPVFYLPLR